MISETYCVPSFIVHWKAYSTFVQFAHGTMNINIDMSMIIHEIIIWVNSVEQVSVKSC